MHNDYRPYLPRETAARGLLEVSLCRWLWKTPTDSSSSTSEEGCVGAAAKASFHNRLYEIPLTHLFNENMLAFETIYVCGFRVHEIF